MCDHRAGWHFKFLQCDHDRNPCKKKRVCRVTVGWNDKPPVKADACAGRAVLHCRFCGGGVSSVFGLRTTIRRHDGEDVLVLHLSFHHPSGYCDASGVCSARLPDPCGTLSGGKQTEYCGTAAGGRVKKMKILEDIGIRYAGIFFFYIKEIIAKKYKKV